MEKRRFYVYAGVAVLLLFAILFSNADTEEDDLVERSKVALRDVGHQLLLFNQDSSSLVLPVIKLGEYKYQLTFQKELTFEPSNLVSVVNSSFQKASLPSDYRTEVVQCSDKEVAYSYEIKNYSEQDIIACAGRNLPKGCYTIEVKFTRLETLLYSKQPIYFALSLLAILFLWDYRRSRNDADNVLFDVDGEFIKISTFQFYPEQNKLIRLQTDIQLSNKECELLSIFVENRNQVVKRDELTKKVWEDNGVLVGRSLDTYISKLRKKLKDDTSIKLSNIHGVGYKLEVGGAL